jgi:hypothetical protein
MGKRDEWTRQVWWCMATMPAVGEAEAGGSKFQGQPGLNSMILCQKKKKNQQT